MGFLFAALVSLIAAAPPARYLDEIFAKAGVVKDLVYGQSALPDGKHQELLLDLYRPEGDAEMKRAAIVWIHGGGFFQGDKSDAPMSILARRFALRGYVTVSIHYRLERKNLTDANLRRPVRATLSSARLMMIRSSSAGVAEKTPQRL